MGTRSRLRNNPLYYKQRRQKKLIRKFSQKGSTNKVHELEACYKLLEFPHMDICDWGGNRYCILCKQGNGKKILNCNTHWCTFHTERFTCKLKKEEKIDSNQRD